MIHDSNPIVLHIFHSSPANTYFENFVAIESVIGRISQKSREQRFSELRNADEVSVEGYDILQPVIQMLKYRDYHIVDLSFIYEEIKDELEKNDYDQIIIHNDVEPIIKEIIDDIGFSGEIINETDTIDTFSYCMNLCNNILRLFYSLFEHIILLLYPNSKIGESDIVIIRHDPKSMDPVINELNRSNADFCVVSPIPLIRHSNRNKFEFDEKNIGSAISLRDFFVEIKFYYHLLWQWKHGHIADEIATQIELRLGFNLAHTTKNVLKDTYLQHNIEIYRQFFNVKSVIRATNCNTLIVGSLSPNGRTIAQQAIDDDLRVYHIPHSIATPFYPTLHGLTHFISGEMDERYLKEYCNIQGSTILPVGRPYLYELYSKYDSTTKDDAQVCLTIATQPFEDKHDFVDTIISIVEEIDRNVNITVKIHPGENSSDYVPYSHRNQGSVRIIEDSLFEILEISDLVITQNSNVGIEAMLIGTPCINYLQSSHRCMMPYMIYGPGPVFRRETELSDYLKNITISRLRKVGESQKMFAETNLQVQQDPTQLIVDEITH